MTPKEKFNDIDFSKVPEKAQIAAKTIKPALFDKKYQAEQYTDTRKQAESQMNVLYDKLLKSYPESIKSKAAKQPEPKTPQAMAVQAAQATIKQPTVKKPKATAGANNRGNVTKLAKEIRKEGEAWHAAMKRAGEMVNKEKGKAVKKANAQYEKLKAFLAKNPSIEKTMVTYGKKPNQGTRPLDVRRDASRVAKPKGKRISADGKTYYEYRANRTDSSRKRYPYLELGGKLFGAGSFAKGGKTKKEEKGNYDSFTKAFLSHGFKKKKSYAGIDFFEKKKDDRTYYGSLDLKNRIVGVEDDYGNSLYNYGGLGMFQNEYFIERLLKVLDKIDKKKSSFAKGGEFGHTFNGAGKFEDGGYIPEGEDYEYVNTFGIPQEDFIMLVDAWHKNESNYSTEAEREYFDILKNLEDKYGVDNITDIIIYVEDTHDSHSEVGKLVQELGHLEAAYDAESSEDYRKDILRQIRFINNELKQLGAEHYASGYVEYAKGGKTNNGDNLPNTVEEYFAAMNNFSMRLGEAEANFANDNGASYQRVLAERDEFFEKTKAKWYAELNEAEGNFAKDGGKSYEAALKKIDDARLRFAKGGFIDLTENKNKASFTIDFNNDFWILDTLIREGHIYSSGISQYLGIDISLVKEKLDALVKKGWVKEEQNITKPHLNKYYITDKGKNEYSKDKYWSYVIIKNKVQHYRNGEPVNIKDVYDYHIYMNGASRKMSGNHYDSREEATQRAEEVIELLKDVKYKEPRNFGLFAKGGKVKGRLSDTHKYVPNRMIQEIEVERKGKTSFIDGADILDGVYVKKGVKFAHGGSMPHVHSKKHKNG